MRGKLIAQLVEPLATRNIPAYAGKTLPRTRSEGHGPEHPRVCGENLGKIEGKKR